nr:MAG TPA: hypothetical protein [Caudoviricetes sp.]
MIGCARHSSSELGSALTCTIIAVENRDDWLCSA